MSLLARATVLLAALLMPAWIESAPQEPRAMTAAGPDAADALTTLQARAAAAEDTLRRGEIPAAQRQYRDVLVDAWMLIGAFARADGRMRKADDAVAHATTIAPGAPKAHNALANRTVAAIPIPGRADIEHRVGTLLASGHYNLGVIAAQQKQSLAAAAQFEAATAADPAFPHAFEGLGVAWFTAGQFNRALPALTRALERDAGNAALRRMVALSAFQLDDWPRAAELLADDPQRLVEPALQFTFGVALVRSGRADEATAAFRQLLAANADSAEVNVVLGLAYAQQGDFDAATTALRHALQLKPDIPQAHATLGTMALKRGELNEAERALRAELAIQPSDMRTRQVLAIVLDLEDRPADALGELRTVIQARPSFADAQYTMGKILLAQGQTAEALGHLEAAARLAPGDANVRYQLAQAYQRAGRTDLARQQFDAFRSLKDARRGEPR